MRTRRNKDLVAGLAAVAMTVALVGCSSADADTGSQAASGASKVTTVRLGYFPNLTHGPALVGMQEGLFKKALKPLNVTVTPTVFNAGPDAVAALFGGSLDITYIGPNPTINAYAESQGDAVRVIAGAASGGAGLVVRDGITQPADLKGKKIATPQLGNTQDVALRSWLSSQGLKTDVDGGGDVNIVPQANAEGLAAFAAGQVDGAWVPQPWVAEYLKAGAHELINEASLWPGGKFVTTNVIVRTEFLNQLPDVVSAFLDGHVAALAQIAGDPAGSAAAANAHLLALTGSQLAPDVLKPAWAGVDFTADPLPATRATSAEHAESVGLRDAEKVSAAGGLPGKLYDLTLLNEALARAGQKTVRTS
jgi:NitT/TauT family transport system substrate-binding protein